jgi:hypothetical protein
MTSQSMKQAIPPRREHYRGDGPSPRTANDPYILSAWSCVDNLSDAPPLNVMPANTGL